MRKGADEIPDVEDYQRYWRANWREKREIRDQENEELLAEYHARQADRNRCTCPPFAINTEDGLMPWDSNCPEHGCDCRQNRSWP